MQLRVIRAHILELELRKMSVLVQYGRMSAGRFFCCGRGALTPQESLWRVRAPAPHQFSGLLSIYTTTQDRTCVNFPLNGEWN
jgi:hypothetical protein